MKMSVFNINWHKLANSNLNKNPLNQISLDEMNHNTVIGHWSGLKSVCDWIIFDTQMAFNLIANAQTEASR